MREMVDNGTRDTNGAKYVNLYYDVRINNDFGLTKSSIRFVPCE